MSDPERPTLSQAKAPCPELRNTGEMLAAYGVDASTVEPTVVDRLSQALAEIRQATRGETVPGIAVGIQAEGTVTVTAMSARDGCIVQLVSQLDLATGAVTRQLAYADDDGRELERLVTRARPG